jgi:hypothetical protein
LESKSIKGSEMEEYRVKRLESHRGICKVSIAISGHITFGSGKLDFNGFWEKPCPECARAWELAYPDDGECWPFQEKKEAEKV